jgi:EmrB/QacA subfamily drug resistance transporter
MSETDPLAEARRDEPAPHGGIAEPPRLAFSHREILSMLSGTVLGMFLGALDQTIVATSLPAMVGDLNGTQHLSWVVSAYLVTSTASTPIYGKLSDLYGRSALFRTAIANFLLGSIVCGLAHSMGWLIAGRALQGLGGGGLVSLALTIIADIVPPRERGRYQAYFTVVWSTAAIGGPMLGGFLVDVASWRWVFWINLPIAMAALLICGKELKRLPRGRGGAEIDYAGIALTIPAIVALLLLTTWAGTEFAWGSPVIVGLGVVAAALFALLVWQERRARDPVLPPRLFRNDIFAVGSVITFLGGAASIGGVIFLPLFLQVVIGTSAGNSGLLILPMMLGITFGATATGRLVRRTGHYKFYPLLGFAAATLAFAYFAGVGRTTPAYAYSAAMAVLGAGLGPMGPAITVAVQNSVDLRDMGTATSLWSFFRSMGGAFGVALLGAILLAGLGDADLGGASGSGLLHGGPAMMSALPPAAQQRIVAGFTHSFHYLYLAAAAMCAAAFVLTLFVREIPLRSRMPARRD